MNGNEGKKAGLEEEVGTLWEVHYMSSYYDDDPRMPGTVPVDERYYFVAGSYEEMVEKASQYKSKLGKLLRKGPGRNRDGDEEEVRTAVVPLENLIVARKSEDDGRLGWYSTNSLAKIHLNKQDMGEYRLVVRLERVREGQSKGGA